MFADALDVSLEFFNMLVNMYIHIYIYKLLAFLKYKSYNLISVHTACTKSHVHFYKMGML